MLNIRSNTGRQEPLFVLVKIQVNAAFLENNLALVKINI